MAVDREAGHFVDRPVHGIQGFGDPLFGHPLRYVEERDLFAGQVGVPKPADRNEADRLLDLRPGLECDLFDVPGVVVVAADDDHLFLAPDDVEMCVGIEEADVSAVEPAIPETGLVGVFVLGVAGCDVLASDLHHAGPVGPERLAVLVDDADLAHGDGRPAGREFGGRLRRLFGVDDLAMRHQAVPVDNACPQGRAGRNGGGDHGRLGQAIAAQEEGLRHAEGPQEVEGLSAGAWIDHLRADQHRPQAAQIIAAHGALALLELEKPDQVFEGGRRRVGQACAVFLDLLKPEQRPAGEVAGIDAHLRHAVIERRQMPPEETEVMEIGQPGAEHVVGRGGREVELRVDVGDDVPVGQPHAFRLARAARGKLQNREVVFIGQGQVRRLEMAQPRLAKDLVGGDHVAAGRRGQRHHQVGVLILPGLEQHGGCGRPRHVADLLRLHVVEGLARQGRERHGDHARQLAAPKQGREEAGRGHDEEQRLAGPPALRQEESRDRPRIGGQGRVSLRRFAGIHRRHVDDLPVSVKTGGPLEHIGQGAATMARD